MKQSKNSNLKYCLKFLKRKSLCYILTLLADKMMVSICYNVVLAFIMKNIINGIAYNDFDSFKQAFVIAVVSFLVAFIFQPIVNKIFKYSVCDTLADIRKKVFKHMVNLKAVDFEKFSAGDILSRITTDVDKLEEVYTNNIPSFTFALIHGTVAIIAMFAENILLATIVTGLGLTSVSVNNIVSKKITNYSDDYQKEIGILNQQIIDIEDGFIDIKTNEAEKVFCNHVFFISDNLKKLFSKRDNQMAKCNVWSNAFGSINFLGIIFVGILLVFKNKTTIGSVIAVVHLQGNAEYLFSTFTEFLGGIRKNLPACGRIVEFLKLQCEDKLNSKVDENVKVKLNKSTLSIENISFKYNKQDRFILDNFSMDIAENGLHVITGESGCGKSTLIKILLGFYEIDSGEIYLNGLSIKDIGIEKLRESISYVPQDAYLFQMSILDNIILGENNVNMKDVERACKIAGVFDFINSLENGYNTTIKENSVNISGGQKQRIALARAFYRNSQILIIDEGTKALNCELEDQIIENLNEISSDRVVIAISHRDAILEKTSNIYNMQKSLILS